MKLLIVSPTQNLHRNVHASHELAELTGMNSSNRFINWLNRILAEEIKCVMRYRSHYFQVLSHPQKIASIFLIHSNEKLLHVDAIALRIVQLGGVPDFSSEKLYSSSSLDVNARLPLSKLIEDNLHAERMAISSYREIIKKIPSGDLATISMLENILYDDECRLVELVDWLRGSVKKNNALRHNADAVFYDS